ncbi:site-specific integrase [Pseudomonas sp. PB101]|uniref:tyrosine-type recombinase/integrase n=1 Tax=Pseudomonas sp. PB101 TaxID=2495428 RepID=UPI00136678B6|nr:tyrosine-type recombinase/integrase [Pseudomonas sp. PB101]MVW84787.1 site-specific integrase [Pseudomonas sp. PB101]
MTDIASRQLYSTLGEFSIFDYFSVDRLGTRDASNMPFMIWPNGSPCLIGNLYMLSLRDRSGRGGRQGLSRRGRKGGTMGDYATKISQLLRLCYKNKIDLIELSDQNFSAFIEELRKEKSPRNAAQPKKTETSILNVGRVWLDFLGFVGRFHGDKNFVSAEGTIRAKEQTYTFVTQTGKKIKRSFLHHHSFGQKTRTHRRNPISAENIKKLKKAVNAIDSSTFVKQRRHCLLDLLQNTGARRTEVGNITTNDILDAFRMEQPLLRLETLKRGDRNERYIPVTKMLLHDIKNHIINLRQKVIKNRYKSGPDHNFLFISETTGKKISSDTITNEISILRKAADISEQACAHMFRHAFITNLFILLIQRHQMSTKDDFQRALLDSHTFMVEVTQWTGHIEPSSIEGYINLAFQSLASYSTTITSVHLVRAMQIFDAKQAELIISLEQGMPIKQYKLEIQTLIQLRDEDFDIARKVEPLAKHTY